MTNLSPLIRLTDKSAKMIKDLTESGIIELLQNNYVGSLGFIAHKSPYVLPVTYYYDRENNYVISYALEGHKTSALRENPMVSLLVYERDSMEHWRSVLLHGVYEELNQIEAKYYLKEFSEGIRKLLEDRGSDEDWYIKDFSVKSETEGIPLVFRICINEWSGKYRDG